MSRRLLTIKYDGSNYCGWQVQDNASTVQFNVQKSLESIIGELPGGIVGCSRTDSGVHANMYCLHFDYDGDITNEKLVMAMNSRLPQDISAVECREVHDDFHARYSCKGKTYIYKIHNSKQRDPFKYKYALQVSRYIDENLLNNAAKAFVGTHDFSGFCSTGSSVKSTVRTVTECSVTRQGDDVIIKISADGFLYNMVRIIVGTLLDVVSGKTNAEDLPKIIQSKDRNLAGVTVKPHGLYLNNVYYDFKGGNYGN